MAARWSWAWLLAALATVAAAPVEVLQNGRTDTVHAERYALDARFLVTGIEIGRALAGHPPLGSPEEPVEIAEAPAPASTRVSREHWTYTVTLRERGGDAVASGRFVVRLMVDGVGAGEVHLAQRNANPAAPEGARATFDVGDDDPTAGLFVVSVAEIPVDERRIVLTSVQDVAWRDDAGALNPTLHARVGEALRFVGVNGDGAYPHNLEITDAQGGSVAGPTLEFEQAGDSQELPWTPEAPGAYAYLCQFHSSMEGRIEVT